ncbi:hypothetical protein [Pseudoclavibacter sp. VKM Ac-2867]|uniref:hypothetical protein n=1 Tax=Pseudoclavibacter sp. VKM Ac-2867 TaxID=2783829 RepID=UPI00188C501D|nr:hypothetical protein [Pseudoclavibacter sp. VKM Ac-2867]MBF4459897.1 hypothetical protein [Pseudoclavibacter sp. VKM Ac-2867]
MTGDEADAPVRALRPLGSAKPEPHSVGPRGLSVDLAGGSVGVLVRVSREGRKHDNLLLLGEAHSARAETLAGLLPDAHVLAPSIDDLGWPQRSRVARETTAHAVVELMDHFSVERAVLVGTEAGADLAVAVAAAHPDRVGALVLVNGGLGDTLPADDHGSSSRDALAGLRVPVAFLFGGSVAETNGYTPSSVSATTSWLRHVDAQEVAAGEHDRFDEQSIAVVADVVESQFASVRARAAHPATGSHRIIAPDDDGN